MDKKNFGAMGDEELAALAKKDRKAEEFLLNKYKNLAKARSKAYFLVGGDSDDLLQEGMIGLFKPYATSTLPRSPHSTPLQSCASSGKFILP